VDGQTAAANGVQIAYETFGDPTDPPVLLVMGLGTQMIAWPDELCQGLADRGLFVVRFDNRDVGLSTHLRDVRAPAPVDIVLRRAAPPYTLSDMADDAAGLLDALGLPVTHLVGASMGGFIAQTMAVNHPTRVRSLTLIMTSTGSRRVGRPRPGLARRLLARRTISDRATAQQLSLETFRAIGSPGYAFDEQYLSDLAGRSYDRAHDPAGYLRQLAAILAQPDRTDQLRQVRVPALVMHGLDDPLVAPSGGLAAARLLPQAKFVGYSGMGHDLPRELWADMEDEIARVVRRGERHAATA
jgi:pimeloyl-ACP methyl ester carboxylesterase